MFRKISLVSCLLLLVFTISLAHATSNKDISEEIAKQKQEITKLQEQNELLKEMVIKLEKAIEPIAEEHNRNARRKALRKRFEERSKADEKIYSQKEIEEAWKIHLKGQNSWGTDKAKRLLKKVIEKYPESNLAGCSALYLGQMSTRQEKEKYLKAAITKYSDCFYGDGVQVGAYATYLLAKYYQEQGKNDEADKLFNDLKEMYPDAIDHRGNLLNKNL